MANMPSPRNLKSPPWAKKALKLAERLGNPKVVSTVGASAAVLALRFTGALQGLELGVYDQMMRWRPTPAPDERILVVGIDEADIQSRQEWPIQDATIAEALTFLTAAEPRAIGLDLFRDVPIGEGKNQLIQQIQQSDRIFSVCKISSADTPGVPPPEGTPIERVGFSDLAVDPGGILRQSLLVAYPSEEAHTVGTHLCNTPAPDALLSLSLRLALSYLAAEDIQLEVTPDFQLRLDDTVLTPVQSNTGGYRNADTSGYQIMLNYRAADDVVPQVSLSELLAGQVPAAQIRDRIVLIGATTPEAKDEFYTPFSGGLRDSQKMPGVIVHAQAVSQILSAVLEARPLIWGWPTWGEAFWIVVWGLGGAIFAWYVRRPLTYALGALAVVGGLIFLQGGWIPLVPAAMSMILASGGVVLLDRFNKSDYGQAVYQQMKSLLRLEIEIDQVKVGEQVAEITDTDYFSYLQTQARELRQKRQSSQTARSQASNPPVSSESPPMSSPASTTESMDDFVDHLKQQASRLKSNGDSDSPSP